MGFGGTRSVVSFNAMGSVVQPENCKESLPLYLRHARVGKPPVEKNCLLQTIEVRGAIGTAPEVLSHFPASA